MTWYETVGMGTNGKGAVQAFDVYQGPWPAASRGDAWERADFISAELPGTIVGLLQVASSGDPAALAETVGHPDFGEGYGVACPVGVSTSLWQQYQQAMQRVMSAAGLSTGAPTTDQSETPAPTTPPAEQPSYGVWVAVGVGALALVGLAAYLATRRHGHREEEK